MFRTRFEWPCSQAPARYWCAPRLRKTRWRQQALAAAGVPLLTDVVVDAAGHEQLFTVVDPATGVQLGFISRTGHRVPISGHNVRALFSALGKL